MAALLKTLPGARRDLSGRFLSRSSFPSTPAFGSWPIPIFLIHLGSGLTLQFDWCRFQSHFNLLIAKRFCQLPQPCPHRNQCGTPTWRGANQIAFSPRPRFEDFTIRITIQMACKMGFDLTVPIWSETDRATQKLGWTQLSEILAKICQDYMRVSIGYP